MTNNTESHADRLARFSAAGPIVMPTRPTDRSKNGQRTPRSVRHRSIR